MQVAASILLSATLIASTGAYAQGAQTSEDIVKFFESDAGLGATRGICIGTEEQCGAKNQAAAPAGLDMLVNFELNSAELTPDARAMLNEFVKALKDERLRQRRFVVEGHTDASGSETYNSGLSERRAHSVTAESGTVAAVPVLATTPPWSSETLGFPVRPRATPDRDRCDAA